jgi:hypothetical protein
VILPVTRLCKNPFSNLIKKRKNMTTLNRQAQNAIVKFHINQALKDLSIEAESSKKKVDTDYK